MVARRHSPRSNNAPPTTTNSPPSSFQNKRSNSNDSLNMKLYFPQEKSSPTMGGAGRQFMLRHRRYKRINYSRRTVGVIVLSTFLSLAIFIVILRPVLFSGEDVEEGKIGSDALRWHSRQRQGNVGDGGVNFLGYHLENSSKQQAGETINSDLEINGNVESQLLQALFELPIPTTPNELSELNEELAALSPSQILQWAHHQFLTSRKSDTKNNRNRKALEVQNPHPLVQVTSFGATGLVILHLLSQLKILDDVPVITMDTLHLFPESYDFYTTIQHFIPQMELIITKPEHEPQDGGPSIPIETKEEFDSLYGDDLWKINHQKYTDITKTQPLNKVLDDFKVEAWITGRRRSQGGDRSSMDVLEFAPFHTTEDHDSGNPFDPTKGRWKLNPLAYWTYHQVWDYIRHHKIPFNSLYDMGYTSLGDTMTTSLPKSLSNAHGGDGVDAFERSGRFIGLNRTECGLHSHIHKINQKKKEALENGEEWVVPKLICENCIELTVDNFEHMVLTLSDEGNKHGELLLEFYSPYCGGCQEFAPTMNRIADYLSSPSSGNLSVKVARFDITEHEIPQVRNEVLFEVEATPTLYRVMYAPSFGVELYEGDHDFDSILRWLSQHGKL